MKNILVALALAACAQTAAAETKTFEFKDLPPPVSTLQPISTDDFVIEFGENVDGCCFLDQQGLSFFGVSGANLYFNEAVTSVSFVTSDIPVPPDLGGVDFSQSGFDYKPRYETVFIHTPQIIFNDKLATWVETIFSPENKIIPFSEGSDDGKLVYGSGTLISSMTYTYADTTAPVPEPKTYTLMLVGLGLLGIIARKRITPAGSACRCT